MAQTIYHRNNAGETCGPGVRRDLSTTPGTRGATQALDAVGDTWNIDLGVTSPPGLIYAAGTWTANLFFSISFGSATINTIVARYDGLCVEQEKMVDDDVVITGAGSLSYSPFGVAGQVAWHPGDLMMCILTRVSGLGGPAVFHFDQSAPSDATRSHIVYPDVVTVRPHEYYKRNSRRRSA